MGRFLEELGSVILWSHDRGTVPYDLMCAAILLFIFLTPSWMFYDQPNPATIAVEPFHQQDISYTQDEEGKWIIFISARLIPPDQDETRLTHTVRTQIKKILKKRFVVTNIKPVGNSNGETVGHSVWLSTTEPKPE